MNMRAPMSGVPKLTVSQCPMPDVRCPTIRGGGWTRSVDGRVRLREVRSLCSSRLRPNARAVRTAVPATSIPSGGSTATSASRYSARWTRVRAAEWTTGAGAAPPLWVLQRQKGSWPWRGSKISGSALARVPFEFCVWKEKPPTGLVPIQKNRCRLGPSGNMTQKSETERMQAPRAVW